MDEHITFGQPSNSSLIRALFLRSILLATASMMLIFEHLMMHQVFETGKFPVIPQEIQRRQQASCVG